MSSPLVCTIARLELSLNFSLHLAGRPGLPLLPPRNRRPQTPSSRSKLLLSTLSLRNDRLGPHGWKPLQEGRAASLRSHHGRCWGVDGSGEEERSEGEDEKERESRRVEASERGRGRDLELMTLVSPATITGRAESACSAGP